MTAAVETLVLPLSGRVFQWRQDQTWRELDPEQLCDETAGRFVPDEDEWVHSTGTLYRQGRGGGWTGEPTWWLVYDELPPGGTPQVRLPDGTEPPVVTLGGIWMCEWVSLPQPATVTVGSESWVVPYERPRFYPDS